MYSITIEARGNTALQIVCDALKYKFKPEVIGFGVLVIGTDSESKKNKIEKYLDDNLVIHKTEKVS